jgi:putative sigma-54 modulation protein
MNIIIKTKNFELTPALREFAEERIGSLKKYFDFFQTDDDPALRSKMDVVAELGKTTAGQRKGDIWRAEVLITFHGNKIRAAESADDLEKAIVAVRDDLQRQITDFKERLLDKARK